ncbi:hypothetical protein MRX96_037179 [Rhipicephalus microplus]
MESNGDEGMRAADVNRSREPSNDGIQNSDQSKEATVLTQRQESMQQASQVLPKSSEARTLELEIQKLNLQIQYENLLQARMNAERLNGTLSNSGSETGDQRRRGFDPVQQCAKVLKGFRLPSDADVPLWFEEVEKLFATYQVPHESRVHLVMPALTERVRYLLRNLNPQESADYEPVKAAMLTELKLSPAEYLQRFERAVKRKEETWAQFASRVKTYFSYYLQVREADTVEVMAKLMVADRIKSGLSTEGLEYVRLREGEGWLRPTEISKVLQTFEQAKGKGRASKQPTVEMGQKPATRVEKGALKCHLCHGSGHFAKECPKASDKENNPKKATEPKWKVQKVTLSHETDTEIPTGVLSAKVKSLKHEGEGTDKLQLIPVSCAGISADAILDTGSEITVIRESLLPRSVVEPSGTVRLVSAFGKTIEARLATLPVKLNSPREVTEPQNVDLLCALTDELVEGTDCLLTKDDWKLLLKASSPLASCRAPAEPAHEAEQAVEKQKESYASAYNRSSRLKAFNVGDQVVVFDNDRSGKMSPKWLGPFTVVGRELEHSYRVETSEGKVKNVHANNIRPDYARVSHIGAVFDEDHDFGEVEYAPQPTNVKREELVVTSEKVAHLDADAQAEIQAVFQRHCTLFDGTPGIAKVDEHKIEIEPGQQPKKGVSVSGAGTIKGRSQPAS